MSDSDTPRTNPIVAGSRVTVIPTFESQSGDTGPQVGTMAEDYADSVTDSTELGRDWALVIRWAIPPTTAVWSSPPRVVSNSPESSSLSEKESRDTSTSLVDISRKSLLKPQ